MKGTEQSLNINVRSLLKYFSIDMQGKKKSCEYCTRFFIKTLIKISQFILDFTELEMYKIQHVHFDLLKEQIMVIVITTL